MKKIFTILLLGLFLISFASALEIDNIKIKTDLSKGGYFDFGEERITDYVKEYPLIEIKNAFGLGKTLFEGYLSQHTETCGQDCSSTIEIKLHEDGILIDDIIFKTLQSDNTWIEQNIRSYQLSYQGEIQDYKTECEITGVSSNGTNIKECSQVKSGTHIGKINYSIGEEVEAGIYTLKLNANKKSSRTVDWIIKTNGETLNEWAVWGNISLGDDAEVILNSPANEYISLSNEVEFNCSAEVTGGATLTNMSLWTNETGSWTTEFSTEEIWDFDFNADGAGGDQFARFGHMITIGSEDKTVISLTKVSSTTATTGYICSGESGTSCATTYATATFVGDLATFSSPFVLNASTNYKIMIDSGGGIYIRRTHIGSGLPVTVDGITWASDENGLTSTFTMAIDFMNLSIGQTTSTQTWNRTLTSPTLWSCQACDSDDDCGFATENRTVSIDTVAPTTTVESPVGALDYGAVGQEETLNVTFTDGNLDSCWYNYNGTNISIDGCLTGVKNSTTFTLEENNLNMTIYANDSVGNLNTTEISWDYKIFQNSFIFDNETRAGDQENFILNITLGAGLDLTSATFMWNGLTDSPSVFSDGQERIISIEDYAIAIYQVDTNVSVYFNLILNDASEINTTNQTQLVSAIFLDNCSTYTNQLFNISLFDEELKTPLLGDIEFNYKLLNTPNYNEINSLNISFTNESNVGICSDINLTDENFVQSIEIRYSSDGYASEFYHIQRTTITEDVVTLNLYDLNASDSTEFKLIYQDNTFTFVENAVIQLQRKYISEDTYEVVEAPLTSSDGVSVVHIDLDTNKYKITVVKNGVVLDTFDNIVFKCQSELTGDCEQKLLGKIDPQNDVDLESILDFSYSEPVINNETITITFSVPSGSPATINTILEQKDMFSNKTLCNKTITSSAGSISCTFSETLGESYIDLFLYKNGEPIAIKTYIIHDDNGLDWLGNNYILIVVLLFSLVGMALTSPEWIIINGIVTMVIAGGLWLANGLDFVTGLGNIVWLVIAAIILISKLAKQEDR